MGKRKRTVCLTLSMLLMASLCACGSKTTSESSDEIRKQIDETQNAPKYMSLVGESEKKVVAQIGQGEQEGNGGNTADDSAVRQYTDGVYGAEADCSVLFNDKKVTMVYITYEPDEMDFETLLEKVAADYGAPTAKSQSEAESISDEDSATAQWELENGSIFIYETVDGCGMQIAS